MLLMRKTSERGAAPSSARSQARARCPARNPDKGPAIVLRRSGLGLGAGWRLAVDAGAQGPGRRRTATGDAKR